MERIGRILIYRLGSLGDTLVALPCFHLIERRFPQAERRILTAAPVDRKAAPVEDVLRGTGLIHGAYYYPPGLRAPAELRTLRRSIAAWHPDMLIYLAEPRGWLAIRRDLLFFRLCGIRRIVGAPVTRDLVRHRARADGTWEPESERLARCLAPLGDAELARPESWDLRLTGAEEDAADRALAGWPGAQAFLAMSIGTKFEVNDWGDAPWRASLAELSRRHRALGIVAIGAAEEFARTASVLESWSGPRLNLCGRLAPRESAALLRRARMFLGHDSGPMHLAAAVGTRAVAVFSARNRPGIWFPHGAGHKPIYHRTPCFSCGLSVCARRDKTCIRSILPAQVIEACEQILEEPPIA